MLVLDGKQALQFALRLIRFRQGFVTELAKLSNRLGVAISTTGGVVMFDTEQDCVAYRQNACSGNLEPEITEIGKLKTASTQFDFKSFSAELRELSHRHQIKLVSVGAMSGLDSGGSGTTYLAIWSERGWGTAGEVKI